MQQVTLFFILQHDLYTENSWGQTKDSTIFQSQIRCKRMGRYIYQLLNGNDTAIEVVYHYKFIHMIWNEAHVEVRTKYIQLPLQSPQLLLAQALSFILKFCIEQGSETF